MLFGYPWFKKFNPDINWEKSELKGPKVKIETLLYGTLQQAKKHGSNRQIKTMKTSFSRHNSVLYGWE